MSLTLGLVVCLVGFATGQFPGGGGGAGMAGLLMNKSVQQELKIDQAQADKLKEAMDKVRAENKDVFDKVRDKNAPKEEREEARKKVTELNAKIMADVLKPEQFKRLKQINWQRQGVIAFSDPEVQKALNLTDEQKTHLRTIGEDLGKERAEIFKNAGDNREEAMKKITALGKEKMESVAKLLTDEQKKAWKELVGEPFEVKFEPRRADK
jgi:hypothetical protein